MRNYKTLTSQLMLVFMLGLSGSALADDARAILDKCLPKAPTLDTESKVHIHISFKTDTPQEHVIKRLENADKLILFSKDPSKLNGYLYEKKDRRITPQDSSLPLPWWVQSEPLFDIEIIKKYPAELSSQNSFGGQNFYNINLSAADTPWPRRSLAFKEDENGCNLIRAAYFIEGKRPAKKFYFQWQSINGDTLFKTLHIEDVQTLEAVRYHIEEVNVVNSISLP